MISLLLTIATWRSTSPATIGLTPPSLTPHQPVAKVAAVGSHRAKLVGKASGNIAIVWTAKIGTLNSCGQIKTKVS